MILNARRGFLESYILGREVFSAEKNEKAMPSVTGKVDLLLSAGLALQKRMKNEKKIFYNRGCKGNR